MGGQDIKQCDGKKAIPALTTLYTTLSLDEYIGKCIALIKSLKHSDTELQHKKCKPFMLIYIILGLRTYHQ